MPCYHPLRAWRTTAGEVQLGKQPADATHLPLPCGKCIGCRTTAAANWALRCTLELQQHHAAVFTTLTYSDDNQPPTLSKRDLQLWLKRLRRSYTDRPIRFFACGEYGERTQRPHYHAIIYGLSPNDKQRIHETWALGITQTVQATPATIAYVAGYTAKKLEQRIMGPKEARLLDPTGTYFYTHQRPFLQMSRRPGIGAYARDHYPNSWRLYAVNNGHKQPVPRYLHERWKQQATPEQLERLQDEKQQYLRTRDHDPARLEAAETIALARQTEKAYRRSI